MAVRKLLFKQCHRHQELLRRMKCRIDVYSMLLCGPASYNSVARRLATIISSVVRLRKHQDVAADVQIL